jgi:hypothetical protein
VSGTLGKITKALGKEETAKKGSAKASLPSVFYRPLDKDFAERLILLSAKKITVMVEETVTDVCRAPKRSTRQRLCSLPSILGQHSVKCMLCAECWSSDARQNVRSLPCAGGVRLGKEHNLCRERRERHSAKIFFWKRLFSPSPDPDWEASHNSFTSLQ